MKYCFCWQVEKVVENRQPERDSIIIEDGNGGTIVACGPWRESKAEADRDGELYRADRQAFFRLLDTVAEKE